MEEFIKQLRIRCLKDDIIHLILALNDISPDECTRFLLVLGKHGVISILVANEFARAIKELQGVPTERPD